MKAIRWGKNLAVRPFFDLRLYCLPVLQLIVSDYMRSTQVLQFFPQRAHVVPAHVVVSINGKFSEHT